MKPEVTLSIAPTVNPKTPEEWQTAVDAADALLHIQSAEAYGLITGAPTVNVERCEELLEAARRRGVTPSAGKVATLPHPTKAKHEPNILQEG